MRARHVPMAWLPPDSAPPLLTHHLDACPACSTRCASRPRACRCGPARLSAPTTSRTTTASGSGLMLAEAVHTGCSQGLKGRPLTKPWYEPSLHSS